MHVAAIIDLIFERSGPEARSLAVEVPKEARRLPTFCIKRLARPAKAGRKKKIGER